MSEKLKGAKSERRINLPQAVESGTQTQLTSGFFFLFSFLYFRWMQCNPFAAFHQYFSIYSVKYSTVP